MMNESNKEKDKKEVLPNQADTDLTEAEALFEKKASIIDIGKTFSEYLTYLRMEQAKKLLRETHDKIYAVAVAVGYEDAFYFSRIFKRETGMTPGDWRKRAEQRGDVP